MLLRELMARPSSKRQTTPIETRGALIDGFLRRGTLS